MKFLSRFCLAIVVALIGSTLPGCGDPLLECPTDSMKIGEERTLTGWNVDEALFWRQHSEDGGGGSFIFNGFASDEFRGGGDESDTRIVQVQFRAERAGTVIITAEEVIMGPPIFPPPFFVEFSTVSCTITISDQVGD